MAAKSFGAITGRMRIRHLAAAAASLGALAAADPAAAQTGQYWDGPNTTPGNVANGRGGSGAWNNTTTNWTNQAGTANAPWAGGTAVFGSGFTFNIAVDPAGVAVTGLTCNACQVIFSGGEVTLAAGAVIDSQVVNAGVAAYLDFDSDLVALGDVTKTGTGTLFLSDDTSINGTLTITGGLVSVIDSTERDATINLNGFGVVVDGGTSTANRPTFVMATGTRATTAGGIIARSAGSVSAARVLSGALWDAGNNDVIVGDAGSGLLQVYSGSLTSLSELRAARVVLGAQAGGRGDLQIWGDAGSSGVITAASVSGGVGGGTVTFDNQSSNPRANPTTFAPTLDGNLAITFLNGEIRLAGTHSYSGATVIDRGMLILNGATLAGTTGVAVNRGVLGGSGSIAGAVTVANAGILEGTAGGALGMGALLLNASSQVNVRLGPPSGTALFNVGGNLTLDGLLNVSDAGGFAAGSYRLFDYGGVLTNNGLVINSLPAGFNPGDWVLDTDTAGRVNLLVPLAGPGEQYWDGPNSTPGGVPNGRGGNGIWDNTTTNWTNQAGTINAPWVRDTAVFGAVTGGIARRYTVTVAAGGVTAGGLSTVNYGNSGANNYGYTFTGGAITFQDGAAITTNAGTIVFRAPLIGLGDLRITNAGGTLTILDGDHEIAGALTIEGRLDIGTSLAGQNVTPTIRLPNAPLIVGDTGIGSVSMFEGGALFSEGGTLGVAAGSRGTLSLLESSWDAGPGDLVLGGAGQGTLRMFSGTDPTEVRAGRIVLGQQASGLGSLQFDNPAQVIAGSVFGGAGGGEVIFGADLQGGNTTPLFFAPTLTGNLSLTIAPLGGTPNGGMILRGTHDYTGPTTVASGPLVLDGAVLSNTSVTLTTGNNEGTFFIGELRGTGTIGGSVTLVDQTILRGASGGVLNINTNLTLSNASNVSVTLGAPSNAALFNIGGNLILDGLLNVSDAGGFAAGAYRLFNYGGVLTNNGLVINSLPAGFNPGDWILDADTAGQVTLLVPGAGAPGIQYWDGANTTPGNVANGRPGNGTWNNSLTNWTNQAGTINAPWAGGTAWFGAAAGAGYAVTIDAGGVSAENLTCQGCSTSFEGGLLTLVDGATIDIQEPVANVLNSLFFQSAINALGGVTKNGDGSLFLSSDNEFNGTFTVNAGAVVVTNLDGEGASLDLNGGGLILDGSTTEILRRTIFTVQNRAQMFTAGGVLGLSADSIVDMSVEFGALWDAGNNEIIIGDAGNGMLDVYSTDLPDEISEIRASRIVLGAQAGGIGELRIIGYQGVLGIVTAQSIFGGVGGGTVEFEDFELNPNTASYVLAPTLDGNLAVNLTNANVRLAGTNTYTGATTITGSRLTLDGANLTATNVALASGALTGTGTIAGTVSVANGSAFELAGSTGSLTMNGTLSPGGDGTIRTLTVNGDLVFGTGSSFRVDVGTGGASDRINVTGTATLAGGLAASSTVQTFGAGTYTLLTAAGGLTGTFNPLTTNPASAPVSLRYDTNNVFLEVQQGSFSLTTSERQSITFAAPVVTTNRVNVFSTQIIGRLLGGQPLYDQTFAAAFADPLVQNGLVAARAAITTAGGPGVIIGDAVRISSSTTSATTSASTYALTNTQSTQEEGVLTFGPSTLNVGQLSTCNVSTLPSATRPTCTEGGTQLVLTDRDSNINVNTNVVYTVAENRTDTVTETLRETYELTGRVAAVGMIHAEVQSGLFDLGGRLLGRLGAVQAGNHGWGEAYRFRVSQSGRRDAWGLAGGFGVALAPGLTFAFGADHGRLDIDVPGALETGEVELTELGAGLRIDSGPFSASLSAVHGFGNAETRRTIIGASNADYDVRVTGAAIDLGYAIDAGGWTVRPVAGLDYIRLSTDGFTESDTLGLIVADRSADRLRGSVGVELGRDFGGVALTAHARYLAILDGRERSLPVAFALAPGNSLDMRGASEPDGVVLGAGVRIPLAPRASLSLGYDGRFGNGYDGHAGRAGLSIAF